MPNIIARLRIKNKVFEILVDCDKSLDLKKGKLDQKSIPNILATDVIFTDHKKGLKASGSEIKESFGTENINEVAERIIKYGELELPQEYREKMRAIKIKQVIDFLAKNCMDPRTNMPYTPTMIETAIKEAGVKIDENRDPHEQAVLVIKQLESKLPIKIAKKRLSVTIPPEYVGRAYTLFQGIDKEKEEWLNDGSMKCIITLPAGMQLEFFDKLNGLTKGSALTQEIKE